MSPRQKSNQNFESNEIFCILLKLDTKNEKLYRYRAEVQDWSHHMIRIKFGGVNSVIQSISTNLQVRKDLAFFIVPRFVQVFAQVEFRFKTRLKSILVVGCQTTISTIFKKKKIVGISSFTFLFRFYRFYYRLSFKAVDKLSKSDASAILFVMSLRILKSALLLKEGYQTRQWSQRSHRSHGHGRHNKE